MKEKANQFLIDTIQKAYDMAEDKLATTKTIYVSDADFKRCLSTHSDIQRDKALRLGFLRTYHKPFLQPVDIGQQYCMGIVHIINASHPDNQPKIYDISSIEGALLRTEEMVKQGYSIKNIEPNDEEFTVVFEKNRGLD